MPEIATDQLLECLAEALETFAFITIEPALEGVPVPATADMYALSFAGRLAGEFQLAAPRELGVVMAANLLGVEPSDELALKGAQDVLKELCNIATGLWLQRRASEEMPEMGLPRVSEMTDWAGMAGRAGVITLYAEGYPILVRMEETA